MTAPLAGKRWPIAIGDTVAALALTAWVGGHAALGAYAARIAFRDLPRDLAASTMTTIFRSFDGLIATAMVLLLAATVLRVLGARYEKRVDKVAFVSGLLLVALGGFELIYVHPQIETLFQAGRTLEPEFATLHKLSARCANVEIALTAVLLSAQAWARRFMIRALALATLLLLSGCPPRQPAACSPGLPAKVELRDGHGALTLSLKQAPGAKTLDLCDGAHHRTATLADDGAFSTLVGEGGKRLLRLERLPNGDLEASGEKGPRLRVHGEPGEIRVLAHDGVPFGSIGAPEGTVAGGALVYNRAQSPIAKVTPRAAEHDYLITATDGTALGYLSPSGKPLAAGVFALADLTPAEQMVLYLELAGR